MALAAMLYVDGAVDERRASPRRSVGQQTTLRQSGRPVPAVLHDLSSTGASIETAEPLAPGSMLMIGLPGAGRFAASVVGVVGTRFGCRFVQPLSPEALRDAFTSDPLVKGSFSGAADSGWAEEIPVDKYPGFVRVGIPVGGAIAGWALILSVIHAWPG